MCPCENSWMLRLGWRAAKEGWPTSENPGSEEWLKGYYLRKRWEHRRMADRGELANPRSVLIRPWWSDKAATLGRPLPFWAWRTLDAKHPNRYIVGVVRRSRTPQFE